jgi:hypothetical protein
VVRRKQLHDGQKVGLGVASLLEELSQAAVTDKASRMERSEVSDRPSRKVGQRMRMHPMPLGESGWVWVGAGSRAAGLRTGRVSKDLRRTRPCRPG